LGKVFEASATAFNGAALRLRADLADIMIAQAEKQGIDVYDKKQAEAMASLAGSMTGRGKTGLTEKQSAFVNVMFFSVKFLKSNVDTLTAHQFDSKATPFTKKQAAKNLVRIAGGTAAILTLAAMLSDDDDTVDWDPRSSNFGKIKIGDTRFDVTGGMAGLVTLVARMIPTMHDGEWGFWSKSGTSGSFSNLTSTEYGARNAMDVFTDFWEGKLSPFTRLFVDRWKGEMFGGEEVTVVNQAKGIFTPIIIQTGEELMKNPNAAPAIASLIVDGLGIGANTYPAGTDWGRNPGKELSQFRDQVGNDTFKEANQNYNTQYAQWLNQQQLNDDYNSLSDEDKKRADLKAKNDIKEGIFDDYGFEYEREDLEDLPSSTEVD